MEILNKMFSYNSLKEAINSVIQSEHDVTLSIFYVTLCTIVVFAVYHWFFRRTRRTPPGPTGLPIVGYLPFLTKKPYLKLQELREKYGPVYSLQVGSKYIIALCDFSSIREAFSQDAFMGRPPDMVFNLSDITIATGAITGLNWREHRRFSLQSLRDLGFGKTRMEEHIREEIGELLHFLEEKVGKPVLLRKFLTPSMSNNISSLVFGRRMKFDDPKRMKIDEYFREITELAGSSVLHMFLPWMKVVSKVLNIGNPVKLQKALNGLKQFIINEVEEHKKTLDPGNVRDFVDGYLLEAERRKNDPSSTFFDEVLADIIGAFFGAGSVTVRITLDWLLLLAAANQDLQRRIQKEIDNAIGRDIFPTRADYKRMAYTEASINELMRWRPIIPMDISRYTLEDTTLNSYFIPKHTNIAFNIWAVHHDKKLWGDDVDKFRPERFLSEEGKEIRKPEYYIPFSIGKRSCPGETLARVEVFLYFTAILQKFNIKLPPGATPDFEGELGVGLGPKPQELILELRQ